jgi:dihydropteroate synthase
MPERIAFLTGHLAEPMLRRVLESLGETEFSWQIINLGVKVAALITEPIVLRRLKMPLSADRVIFPGRAGLDAERLSAHFGVPFIRGPEDLIDLPQFLGRNAAEPDLSRHNVRIFAEIVDAPLFGTERLLELARKMAQDGADVIDLGCKPGTEFPHLEETIAALHAEGFQVSVDSGNPAELQRAARAGAEFLLSLTEKTLSLAEGTNAIPVLVPAKAGDLASLERAARAAEAKAMRFLVDPVLDPIHFGFTDSLMRFVAARKRLPQAEMLMGTGNLTELTDADSSGVTALLLGICSELEITNVLVVHVSPHTRRTIAEHDICRRLMFAARRDQSLPRLYSDALLQVHERRPFPHTPADIAALAQAVRDPSYRIMVAEDGIHVFNNRMHIVRQDAMSCFEALDVARDGAHAFYLGTELAKAEIAWRLGKRYVQDAPLHWGVAAPRPPERRTGLQEAGQTLKAAKTDASRTDDEGNTAEKSRAGLHALRS